MSHVFRSDAHDRAVGHAMRGERIAAWWGAGAIACYRRGATYHHDTRAWGDAAPEELDEAIRWAADRWRVKPAYSPGSLARRLAQRLGAHGHPIEDRHAATLLHDATAAGRIQVIRPGRHALAHSWDLRRAYLHEMTGSLPVGLPTPHGPEAMVRVAERGERWGVAMADVDLAPQGARQDIGCLPVRTYHEGDRVLCYPPRGHARGAWTLTDLRLARELGCDVRLGYGVSWPMAEIPWCRRFARIIADSAEEHPCLKILAAAAVGTWAQSGRKRRCVWADSEEERRRIMRANAPGHPLALGHLVAYLEPVARRPPWSAPARAAAVWAAARARLLRGMVAVGAPIAVATDGILAIPGRAPSPVGPEPGQWRREPDLHGLEIAGANHWRARTPDGEEVYRASGIEEARAGAWLQGRLFQPPPSLARECRVDSEGRNHVSWE